MELRKSAPKTRAFELARLVASAMERDFTIYVNVPLKEERLEHFWHVSLSKGVNYSSATHTFIMSDQEVRGFLKGLYACLFQFKNPV